MSIITLYFSCLNIKQIQWFMFPLSKGAAATFCIMISVGEFHCDGRTVQRGKHQVLGDSLV